MPLFPLSLLPKPEREKRAPQSLDFILFATSLHPSHSLPRLLPPPSAIRPVAAQGPMYTTPLMGFIDEHCIIFDGEDENKLEFTGIHEAFKVGLYKCALWNHKSFLPPDVAWKQGASIA
jgi:hypothetical protein